MSEKTPFQHEIAELIVTALHLEDVAADDIGLDDPLFGDGLGLDSVDALELAVGIMNTFDVEVSDDDMHIFEYVNTIDQFIAERIVETT